jgi:Flp pilus assembly protein TadD
MDATSLTEKTWLVKSSGMILGPFSIEELVQALREKKVSLIDEVRSPENRWGFIREHRQFTEIVQMLREQQDLSREDTGQTFVENTITHTDTEETWSGSKGGVLKPLDPLEHTVTQIDVEDEPQTQVQIQPKSPLAPQVQTPAVTTPTPAPVPTPVYAVNTDQKVKQKFARENRRSSLMIWVIFFLMAAGLGGLFTLRKESSSKALGFEDYLKLARTNKNLGRWEKSLEFYKKAEALHALDFSSKLQMAPLLMVVENQNVQARQNLETLLATSAPDLKIRQEIQSLVALSYLREVQLDEADKRYKEILANDPQNEAAKLNLLEIQILQGDFEGAARQITNLIKQGIQDSFLTLYRALVIYRSSDDAARLKMSEEDLTRFLARSQDFEPEVQLLRAAIQKKLNQPQGVTDALTQLLNIYPDLTKEHEHDFLVHREILQWSYLSNICEILLHDAPSSALYSGLKSYCSYQQGDLKAAIQSIDQARLQNAQDSTLIGLNAFLLVKAGRTSEARALFQLPAAHESPVVHSVRARLCQEQKEFSCAEEQWKLLQSKDPHSVETFAGLARVFLSKGQKEFARDLVKQGLLVSSNYQPLLEIRDQLNEP